EQTTLQPIVGLDNWDRAAMPAQGDETRQLRARTRMGPGAAAETAAQLRPEASSCPASVLLRSKLVAPGPRAGHIARAGVGSLLQAGLEAKLCLVAAPAGSGKTTLLAHWRTTAGAGRVAWVSLDEEDNDPTRLWVYVVEALHTVEPGVGATALDALGRRSVDHEQAVLASLLHELSRIDSPLVLVLDDYPLITNPPCHQTTR